MPTQLQFNTSLQTIRDIDCKLFVLDYDYAVIDEISGKTESVSLSVNAESDIRRTANISMVLKDDTKQTNSNIFYWTVGNPYWFDKYIQIYVAIKDIQSNEYVWVNEGIYMVNSPSITYDAVTNSLSFEAVDLMSKLTGLRNGQLEGMTYTIPVGSTIVGGIESVLLEQGFTQYILLTPPQKTVPQDINIDVGDTAYNLLCQLRDINSNWEMFFDVDGIFHFQPIPSGKVIVDPTTGEEGEPTPVVDNTVWDKLNISYNLNTSFEDVKNYVEVLGKMHEPDEYADATVSGSSLTLALNYPYTHYLNGNNWLIGFAIATSGSADYTILSNPINLIRLYDSDGVLMKTFSILTQPIEVGNQYYCLTMGLGSTLSSIAVNYIGFMQPRAIALENNPDSPFYVGTSTQYVCSTQNEIIFANEKELVDGELDVVTASNLIHLNLSPWCTAEDFSSAAVGKQWKFKINVTNTGSYDITLMNVNVGGLSYTALQIYGTDDRRISLDFSQSYMVIMTKTSSSAAQFRVSYYPIPASEIYFSTTNIANVPRFNNQVRYVCSGGEYDNIYTNELAEQRARYEIYLHARLHDSINITCVPIYWLDVNQIIEYRLPNNTSKESDYWLVKSISTDVSTDGTQTINAIRYYAEYA